MRPISFPSNWSFVLLAGVSFTCSGIMAEEPVPVAFPQARYDAVRLHSPFAVATAEAPPLPATASFAANWFVSGIGRLGDEDFVTIKSRDLSTPQFSLFGKSDSASGVSLASVTWSEAIGKSTVILRKGTETAKLEFNEADIKAGPQPQGPVTSPPPGTNPMNAAQRPVNRSPITPPAGISGRPVAPPPGTEVRRRVQVIQPPSPR